MAEMPQAKSETMGKMSADDSMQQFPQLEAVADHHPALADRGVGSLDGGAKILAMNLVGEFETVLTAHHVRAHLLGHQANLPFAPVQTERDLPARLPTILPQPMAQNLHVAWGDRGDR